MPSDEAFPVTTLSTARPDPGRLDGTGMIRS
jgi:hypothetical protein